MILQALSAGRSGVSSQRSPEPAAVRFVSVGSARDAFLAPGRSERREAELGGHRHHRVTTGSSAAIGHQGLEDPVRVDGQRGPRCLLCPVHVTLDDFRGSSPERSSRPQRAHRSPHPPLERPC